MGLIPGGAYRNQEHVSRLLDAGDVDEVYVDLLCDPQTSGGLLFAVPEEEAEEMLRVLVVRGSGNKGIRSRKSDRSRRGSSVYQAS